MKMGELTRMASDAMTIAESMLGIVVCIVTCECELAAEHTELPLLYKRS